MQYYRVMLGKGSKHAEECVAGGFIGTDFKIHQDLTKKLTDQWRAFNKKMIPVYMKVWPDKSKVAAGLACGAVWTVSRGLLTGDIVLCPDGKGRYHVGRIKSDYYYAKDEILPHRRDVEWLDKPVRREDMSQALKYSTGSIGTVSNITKYAEEIDKLIGGSKPAAVVSEEGEIIEDPSVFAMEKHLEDFLVRNWKQTELGKKYNIFEEDGEIVGQQYPTDTGPIDILAVSKNKKTLLVVELKRGRASDAVVGQVLRYMGYVKEELAEKGQTVKGMVIALEDDQKLRRALAMVDTVDYYRYEVSFTLKRG
ncbi:MAG: endonuclease NucS domain-containing protein [Planctomycetota bacterium]